VKKRIILATIGIAVLALGVVTAGYAAKSAKTKHVAVPKGFKVGLVTDIGGLNDRGFNHLSFVGLKRAANQYHFKYKVDTSNSSADYIPNLSSLAKAGYNLVIGVGFLQEQAIQQMAKKFPKVKFAGVDMNAIADFTKPKITKNFEGLIFAENEVGYEVGYLAGLEAKRLSAGDSSKNVVSSVGGIPVPAVIRYIAGYQAGAKAADPGVTTLNGYSQDFVAQDKCKSVALDQISQGSQVVFQVAGGCGLGALDAAKEKSVWGIGVDSDQSFVNNKVLTSAQKKVDVSVYTAISNLVKGRFAAGQNLVFNAKNGGVGLGKIHAGIPKAEVTATLAVAKRVASGKIKPPVKCSPNPNC
jgi:basic membrane protein A